MQNVWEFSMATLPQQRHYFDVSVVFVRTLHLTTSNSKCGALIMQTIGCKIFLYCWKIYIFSSNYLEIVKNYARCLAPNMDTLPQQRHYFDISVVFVWRTPHLITSNSMYRALIMQTISVKYFFTPELLENIHIFIQ